MRGAQLGKYQLIQHLASGGMARVYLARVTGPGGFERHVVLKTLRTKHVADPALVPMFLDEARLAASLHHRNIAQVFDVGIDNGTYFLAMEYVHGETLRAVMETAFAQDGMLPLDFGVTVLCAAAAGLHHAHERRGARGVPLGIVHRDVAPSNLIVCYDGSIKLIDFGIAKAAERATHTKTGFIKGKAGYMAPEQIRGYPVDRRTDVFALGILAYEVMTLRRAFAGNTQFETLDRTVRSDLLLPTKAVPGFPPELEEVIMTALEIDPDDRYPNADVMRRDLDRVAARLGLSTGESAVLPVLEKLFGIRLEPWLGGAASRSGVGERHDSIMVPLVPRTAVEGIRMRARGTGADDAIPDDEEPTTARWPTSEELVTNRLVTADVAFELPLPAPELETLPVVKSTGELETVPVVRSAGEREVPVHVERSAGVLEAVEKSTGEPARASWPSAPRRGSGLAWIVVVGALLAAATVVTIAIVTIAAHPAPAPRVRREPAVPALTAPAPAPPHRSAPPTIAPAASTEVTLSVTTEPPGATVVLDGVRLGTTPYTGKVLRRSKLAWLKVRRRGSVATKTQVSLEQDVTWSVQLRARRAAMESSQD